METQEDNIQRDTSKSPTARIAPLATLVVGLVVGALVGYLGRPLLMPQLSPPTPVKSASAVSASSPGNASGSTLIDAVVAQTRHFRGEPNAPVTIIEFGDFQ